MAFILDEDRALKAKLEGITVSDFRHADRPVKVWFRFPQKELTEADYPFMVIDLVAISEALERAHRNRIVLEYIPEGTTVADNTDNTKLVTEFPIPYDLVYTVTTYCRHPQHDRSLISSMLQWDRLPHRFGFLEIPEDNTKRRLDLRGVYPNDVIDRDNKTLFRKVFVVQVSTELMLSAIDEVGLAAAGVVLDLKSSSIDNNVAQNAGLLP